jgi:hypothetical protein
VIVRVSERFPKGTSGQEVADRSGSDLGKDTQRQEIESLVHHHRIPNPLGGSKG